MSALDMWWLKTWVNESLNTVSKLDETAKACIEDLLVVNVAFQCLDAVYLGGLQADLFFPRVLDPVKEGGTALLVVL